MSAEDYTGPSPAQDTSGPAYLATFEQALADAHVGYDVYDVDATAATAPTNLGVLSHYKAVVWYTGEDLYTREPGQPGGTGVSKLLDDEILERPRLPQRGREGAHQRQVRPAGRWDGFLYNPLGSPPGPPCASNQTQGDGDVPPGQVENCVAVSNDFLQYWLGAYIPINAAADTDAAAALPFREVAPVGDLRVRRQRRGLGAEPGQRHDVPDDVEHPQAGHLPAVQSPTRRSSSTARRAYDPPTGSGYAFSRSGDQSYRRLAKTFSVPAGATSADLSFKLSYDTEPDWDYVFVEAHTAGQDDWTTLPDVNGHTSQDLGLSCPQIPMVELHPFVAHYETYNGPAGGSADATCDPTGTTGAWNAATGNSGGFQDWKVDLSAYKGKDVEVSITYITDPATHGLGAFVDDATFSVDGTAADTAGFETGLGRLDRPRRARGLPGQLGRLGADRVRRLRRRPGVRTDRSLYWGFGLEGVTGAPARAQLVHDALAYLGAP